MNKRNAFTLIEVLLAVFIIGLGSIGLFALFAGVASQQTRAAELTRAVGQAQGLLGAMEGRVGPIGEWKDGIGVPFSDPVFGEPLVRGVWYPTFSYYDDADPSLSLNPRATNNLLRGRYFVSPKVEAEVFSNPAVFTGASYQPATGMMGNGTFFSTDPAASTLYAGAQLVRLPHTRAALGTVEIEFWKSDILTGAESLAFAVSDLPLVPLVSHNDLASQSEAGVDYLLPEGAMPGEPQVRFFYAERPTGSAYSSLAGINQFDLSSVLTPGFEWISSIRIRYAHRGDRLLGLGERLVTVPDDTRPSGRRAIAGATAMYRITPRGRSQFVTIAYTVNPLGREGDFVPPERPTATGEEATNGLLRVSEDEYSLVYDETRAEYYMTWNDNDDLALVEGDIVIVGGQLNPPVNSNINVYGADDPVTVSRVLTIGNEQRAYLNDTPRVLGRSMGVGSTGGSPVDIFRVFTLRREVEVTDANDVTSRWELRPVLYQTLDVQ